MLGKIFIFMGPKSALAASTKAMRSNECDAASSHAVTEQLTRHLRPLPALASGNLAHMQRLAGPRTANQSPAFLRSAAGLHELQLHVRTS